MIRRIRSRIRGGRNRHVSVPLALVMIKEPVLRVATLELLRDHDFAVREVTSLQEAIWRTDLEPPDVILLEVREDWAAARMAARSFRVQRGTSEVPVIALASAAPASTSDRHGIDSVLVRPFTGREILERIEGGLERGRAVGGAASGSSSG